MVIALLVAAALICWPAQTWPARRSGQQIDRRPRFGQQFPRPGVVRGIGVAVGAAAVATVTGFAGAAAGAAVAIALWTVKFLAEQQLSSSRRRHGLADILAAVRMLARELQAGAEPLTATGNAAALARGDGATVLHGLALVMQAHDPGGSVRRARLPNQWPTASRASPSPSTRSGSDERGGTGIWKQSSPVADALWSLTAGWTLSSRSGVALGPLIEAVTAEMAEALSADARRAGEVAGPRMSGYVMSGLPVMGLLLGAGMGADPIGVLLGTTVGHILLVTGVLLTSAGLLWSARIVGQ